MEHASSKSTFSHMYFGAAVLMKSVQPPIPHEVGSVKHVQDTHSLSGVALQAHMQAFLQTDRWPQASKPSSPPQPWC